METTSQQQTPSRIPANTGVLMSSNDSFIESVRKDLIEDHLAAARGTPREPYPESCATCSFAAVLALTAVVLLTILLAAAFP